MMDSTQTMEPILKILMVEDRETDAELIKHQIRKNGIQFVAHVVDNKMDYLKAIQDYKPDLILSDFSLPVFDGMQALLIRKEKAPAIPFILVTGTINEETAVDVMKSGADDYVIKEHIARLGPAIKEAVAKTENIRKKNEAEKQLRVLSRAIDQNPASIVITNFRGDIEYVNPKFTQVTGYSLEEVIGKNPRILKSGNKSPEEYRILWETITSGKEWRGEFENIRKNGDCYFETAIISPIADEKGVITQFVAVKEDVTERKLIDKKVTLLAHSLESISECVLVTDNDHRIIYTNESFNKTYGYEENEVIGEHRNILLAPGSIPKEGENILQETRKGYWRGEVINQRKDGSLFPVLLSTSEIKDEQDKPLAQISVAMEITEMIRSRDELMQAKQKAEEANRLKSAILNNMSHEIRTPMNAIMGFSSLMAEANEEEKNNFADIIVKSSNQLLTVIDEVILLSRLQSEKMAVNYTTFSPAESIIDVHAMFSYQDMKKGIKLKMSIPEEHKELRILADGNKIKQVMTNLTSNAIKFTPQGIIELGFEVGREQIEFFVRDTGMGIPEKEQPLIFDTFYRGEKAIASAIGGTGLGLSISKELVELLGGTIGVTSESNSGSRFYFTVPLRSLKQRATSKPSMSQYAKDIRDFSILVVDDEAVNCHYLEVLLKNKVKRVDRALNGQEAVDMATKNRYNIVLMDIKMPVMGGIEATKILKEQTPDLCIVAQTAFALPEEAATILEAGCDDILCKPVKRESLMEMIYKHG